MDHPLVCQTQSQGHAIGQSASVARSGIETVSTGTLLDLAGLILYGAQAIPIRLKVLFDRLITGLPRDQVTQSLSTFGWTDDDYSRGYMLQVIMIQVDTSSGVKTSLAQTLICSFVLVVSIYYHTNTSCKG